MRRSPSGRWLFACGLPAAAVAHLRSAAPPAAPLPLQAPRGRHPFPIGAVSGAGGEVEDVANFGWEQWVFCADKQMQCECPGMIRWGATDQWHSISPTPGIPTTCSVEKLGSGDVRHPTDDHCECAVKRGSDLWLRLSPAVLPQDDAPRPAVSCAHFHHAGAAAAATAWERKLWSSMAGLCRGAGAEPVGEDASMLPDAGPLALDPVVVDGLMEAWVDPRFQRNYERVYDESGWVERAFVNYVGNCVEGGRYDRMMHQLIRSVHLFSKEPIIVLHFGMVPPRGWDPELYPRLVLLHAKPLPQANIWRSFNYNKYRAMLLARVRVGIELDSDEFLAPGVDAMFQRTAQEVTEDYPFPILPVHFLPNKGPSSGGVWWSRFCHEDGSCPLQTMRWAHAHPTWTYHALPWIGKWLRRNLRDEVLRPRPGYNGSSLRVVEVPEDEDLLNVGLWEDGAHKQWCKFETPDPSDFLILLNRNTDGSHDIVGDQRFYPDGAPLVFYTAHHAVDPDTSERLVDALRDRHEAGTLPPPITFKGGFFRDAGDLRRERGDVPCLI